MFKSKSTSAIELAANLEHDTFEAAQKASDELYSEIGNGLQQNSFDLEMLLLMAAATSLAVERIYAEDKLCDVLIKEFAIRMAVIASKFPIFSEPKAALSYTQQRVNLYRKIYYEQYEAYDQKKTNLGPSHYLSQQFAQNLGLELGFGDSLRVGTQFDSFNIGMLYTLAEYKKTVRLKRS